MNSPVPTLAELAERKCYFCTKPFDKSEGLIECMSCRQTIHEHCYNTFNMLQRVIYSRCREDFSPQSVISCKDIIPYIEDAKTMSSDIDAEI